MQLADSEQVISEVPLGSAPLFGALVLTNRRLVMTSPNTEESIPLAHVASIRSAYLRDYAGAAAGVVILAIALIFGAGYKNLETAVNGAIYTAQKHFFEKTTADSDGNNYGRYINISAGLVWLLMLPLVGWGGYKAYKGGYGETELTVGTAAGELRRARDGNRRDFRDFVEEAGRRLP
jgi:hypothetical protein